MSLVAPSLLIPAHSPDIHPRGGILLNSLDSLRIRTEHDPDSPPASTAAMGTPAFEKSSYLASPTSDSGSRSALGAAAGAAGGGANGGGGGGPASPLYGPSGGSIAGGSASGSGVTPRIRFAPLPDPHRPRSASAGESEAPTGTGLSSPSGHSHSHQTLVVRKNYDNDQAVYDDDDEYHTDGEIEKRGRSWSKSMGMGSMSIGSMGMGSMSTMVPGWKETKKLLTGKSGSDEGYDDGAPLKKSISTGGFVGSSPFRWTSQDDRKKQMLGSSLPSSNSIPSPSAAPRDSSAHRRNSSLEATAATQLGSSPNKSVKMLNGRVYGSRRASQGAIRSEEWRKQNEPAFVEWGNASSGMGMGSAAPVAKKAGGFLGDDDDGSGMDWVRKRRERKEQAERERLESESATSNPAGTSASAGTSPESATLGLPSLASPTASSPAGQQSLQPLTPASNSAELPPTPVIHISEHFSPPLHKQPRPFEFNDSLPPVQEASGTIVGAAVANKHTHSQSWSQPSSSASASASTKSTPSIAMPVSPNEPRNRGAEQHRDVFDETPETSTAAGGRPHVQAHEHDNSNAIASDSESESEEESDNGDFSDDDDAEEEAARTTSSAAGVEKISRHKD